LHPQKLGNKIDISITEGVKDVQYILWSPREVWMKIRLENIENHKGVAVEALLDSRTTSLLMNRMFAEKKEFKIKKLRELVVVKNVNGTKNSKEAITHEVKCNMFFKGHIERVKINICNLGKTKVIREIP